jgi:glycosyltransferase involved in cell wall biosynthesis
LPDSSRRVAFCITELDAGGAERALVQIVTRLDRQHWTPQVYCLAGPGELVAVLESAGITVECLNARSKWDVGVVGRLATSLRQFGPDVLQTFLFHANMIGRLAARRARVPVVVSGVRVSEHDARWRMRLDCWTNRLVRHNVCVSTAVAEAYHQLGIPDTKLSVIPNGVVVAAFESAAPADLSVFGIPAGARVLLAIGRLHPQKGFDLLIDAADPILEGHPDVHLLIVGDGPQRLVLERMAATSEHAGRIHLLRRQSNIPGLLRACTLFVLSSRWEGMPNVLLEALAAGAAVVATDVEGVRDVVEDGVSGAIVQRESAHELSNGIACLLSDPESSARLAAAGQEHVRSEFTWGRAVEQYTRLWSRLIDQSPANG